MSLATTTCTVCGLGKVAPDEGMTTCRYCQLGKYNDDGNYDEGTDVTLHDGLDDCTSCDAGKLSEKTFDACYVCPGGTYVFNATSCIDCAAGKYAPTAVNNDCITCDIGFFTGMINASTTCTACDAGTYSWGLAIACRDCKAGKFSLTRSANCTTCALGFIAPKAKSSSCTACDVGTYAPDLGSIVCSPCPAGKAQGATGQGYCDVCEKGTFMPNTGATFCTSCDAGTYQPSNASESCIDCIPGRFQSATAQTGCDNCEAGKYLNESRGSTCTACSDVSSSFPGSTSCDICNRNYYLSAIAVQARKKDPEVEVCLECSQSNPGIDCSQTGSTVSALRIKEGYWRVTAEPSSANDDEGGDDGSARRRLSSDSSDSSDDTVLSEDVLPCAFKGICLGGNNTEHHSDGSGPYCVRGNTGPYCTVCIDDWEPDGAKPGFCKECEQLNMATVILVGSSILGGCAALVFLRKYVKVNADGVLEWRTELSSQVGAGAGEDQAGPSSDGETTVQSGASGEWYDAIDEEEENTEKKQKERAVDLMTVGKILFGECVCSSILLV